MALLRKRAWDIMRDDFFTVVEGAGFTQIIKTLNASLAKQPDNDFVVIVSRTGSFRGIVTMMDILRGMGPCLLEYSATDSESLDFESACIRACQVCSNVEVEQVMQTDVPRVKPSDVLSVIMDKFFEYRRARAVVEEGDKVIGVVHKKDLYLEIARDVDQW